MSIDKDRILTVFQVGAFKINGLDAGEVVRELIAEIEKLSGCDKAYAEVWEKARSLQAECDEFERDAERYRWLRGRDDYEVVLHQGERLDKIVDVGLSKEKAND